MTRRRSVDLFGVNYGDDALFDLTPAATRTLVRPAVAGGVVPPPLAPEWVGDTLRLHLPRWDLAWEAKKVRGGWPRINPKTGKVVRHRRVWDALKGNARNAHYAQRSKATREVIDAVVAAATRAGLKPCRHLTVCLVWAPGDNRRADDDNLWTLLKVCCDALARGRSDLPGLRLVPDDTRQYMNKLAPRIERPPTSPGLWLEIQQQ